MVGTRVFRVENIPQTRDGNDTVYREETKRLATVKVRRDKPPAKRLPRPVSSDADLDAAGLTVEHARELARRMLWRGGVG